jgi:hypothetical protein
MAGRLCRGHSFTYKNHEEKTINSQLSAISPSCAISYQLSVRHSQREGGSAISSRARHGFIANRAHMEAARARAF